MIFLRQEVNTLTDAFACQMYRAFSASFWLLAFHVLTKRFQNLCKILNYYYNLFYQKIY